MRNLGSPLSTFLANGRNVRCADLWTFTLAGGQTLRWSGSDREYRYGGNTYTLGPGIARGKIRWSLTLDVDSMDATLTVRPTDLIGSTPLALAIRRGDFDYAGVRLSRAYGVAPDGSIAGGVIDNYFVGRVGPIEGDGFEFPLSIVSPMEALDAPFPRNVVQAQCGNRLFDEVCALNSESSSWKYSGTVTGAPNAANTTFTTSLAKPAGFFTLGRLVWTSGPNTGRSATVRLHDSTGGLLKFSVGWPETVAIGNAFVIYAGCDRTKGTCESKFSNIVHFRGFPFVPAPETTT